MGTLPLYKKNNHVKVPYSNQERLPDQLEVCRGKVDHCLQRDQRFAPDVCRCFLLGNRHPRSVHLRRLAWVQQHRQRDTRPCPARILHCAFYPPCRMVLALVLASFGSLLPRLLGVCLSCLSLASPTRTSLLVLDSVPVCLSHGTRPAAPSTCTVFLAPPSLCSSRATPTTGLPTSFPTSSVRLSGSLLPWPSTTFRST